MHFDLEALLQDSSHVEGDARVTVILGEHAATKTIAGGDLLYLRKAVQGYRARKASAARDGIAALKTRRRFGVEPRPEPVEAAPPPAWVRRPRFKS